VATISAMPLLEELLADEYHTSILTLLRAVPFNQYDNSLVVRRDVRRIPLKLDIATAVDEKEAKHLQASYDGLAHFYPVDIYPENIASTDGLLTSFRRLQLLEGFGLQDHHRFGSYSLLHVDVSIYWQLLRFLYCYSGMAPVRHDLFLCFGFWHAYSYAHVALWSAFRMTFLADAFWAVFPSQRLLRRPSLILSSTLITWIRFAFPRFKDYLITKITELRYAMLDFDVNLVTNLERGIVTTKISPFRSKYIHLLNLYTLLEFCIPVIQDYGVALKSNDWPLFYNCLLSIMAFLLMCNGKGAADYQRSMYCFLMTLRYWAHHQLPVIKLLETNHTIFSEESGEIALSVLATSQATSSRSKLDQVRKAWQFVRTRFEYHDSIDGLARNKKKHRILSKSRILLRGGMLWTFFLSHHSYCPSAKIIPPFVQR
jgi:hypothetical protein